MSEMDRDATTDAAAPKRKLGRGLGALMGEARREEALPRISDPLASVGNAALQHKNAAPRSGLANLAVAVIEPHPGQPRRRFDEQALEELAASIETRGMIQPVIVRPLAGGRYQLVAGERRWRAAQKAQLHEIPALIRELDEREVTALALIENLQREDLTPVEEARAYEKLGEEGMTQAQIAKLVEKSRSHVTNTMRLLALPEAVLELVEDGKLEMGHARALVGFDGAEELAAEAAARKLTVRQVESLMRQASNPRPQRRHAREPRSPDANADLANIERVLEDFLGLSVKITPDADPRGGTLTVRYRTLDQLDLVCERLTGREL